MGATASKPDPSRSLEVICAGYSRTGTLSMQVALTKLLDGPVIHGGSWLFSSEDEWCKKWTELLDAKHDGEKERELKLLREVTAGYAGCTDVPMNFCVPELLELYPDAKVVLTTRDPKKWWQSMQGNLDHSYSWWVPYFTIIAPTLRWFPGLLQRWVRYTNDELLDRKQPDPATWGPHVLELHNKMIIDAVPKDRLLIMNIKEGWEPLCRFLGKPIPDEPFPRTNDKEAGDKVAAGILAKLLLMWAGIFSTAGAGIYMGWRLMRR